MSTRNLDKLMAPKSIVAIGASTRARSVGAAVTRNLLDSGFAGEMGHIPIVPNGRKCHCGRRGCLETVASEWALIERISERLERSVDLDEVMALALNGDKLVRSEINKLCKYLALAIAHVVNLFDPQCVFVNGPLFDHLPWLREHLLARARQLALEPAGRLLILYKLLLEFVIKWFLLKLMKPF